MNRPPPESPLFPYPTLFRSAPPGRGTCRCRDAAVLGHQQGPRHQHGLQARERGSRARRRGRRDGGGHGFHVLWLVADRKSTRLNSSHTVISYAVFCLKQKISPLNSSHIDLVSRPLLEPEWRVRRATHAEVSKERTSVAGTNRMAAKTPGTTGTKLTVV